MSIPSRRRGSGSVVPWTPPPSSRPHQHGVGGSGRQTLGAPVHPQPPTAHPPGHGATPVRRQVDVRSAGLEKRKRDQNLNLTTEVTPSKLETKLFLLALMVPPVSASFSLPQHIKGKGQGGQPPPISGTSKTIAFLTKTQSRLVSVVSGDVLRP